jgi:glycosyltransferase involved in cell wall biosynthesis
MNAPPTVSVVIPAYRHSQYVVTTLESVFRQSFTDYEVIVINDGSPDETAEVVRPYVEAQRIRYVEQQNSGIAAARNRGLAEARGQFIAYLDDDDIWPEDKLQWQVKELLDRSELSAVAGALTIINEVGVEIFRPPIKDGDLTFESLFDGSPLYSPGQVLMRTNVVRALGGFDSTIWGADDFDIWFRLVKTGPLSVRHRCALYYRVHRANASNNGARMFEEIQRVLNLHLADVSHNARPALRKRAHRFLYSHGFSRVLARAKHLLRRGDFTELPNVARAIVRLAPCAIADPIILLWFLRDILPRRWMSGRDGAIVGRLSFL